MRPTVVGDLRRPVGLPVRRWHARARLRSARREICGVPEAGAWAPHDRRRAPRAVSSRGPPLRGPGRPRRTDLPARARRRDRRRPGDGRGDRRQDRALQTALGADAAAVDFVDMGGMGANPARIIPAWRAFLAQHPGRRVLGVGEPIHPARRAEETVECQLHESLLNLAFGDAAGFRLVCPYDTAALEPEVVHEAHCSHPVIARERRRGAEPRVPGSEGALSLFETPLPPPPSPRRPSPSGRLAGRGARLRDAAAARAGLDEAGLRNIVLAAHEVATNSLRHGGGLGVLRVWADRTASSPRSATGAASATRWPAGTPPCWTSPAGGGCGSPTRRATSCSCATSTTARSSGSSCAAATAAARIRNAAATAPQRLPGRFSSTRPPRTGRRPPPEGVPVPAPRIITAERSASSSATSSGQLGPAAPRDRPLQRGAAGRRLAPGDHRRAAAPHRPLSTSAGAAAATTSSSPTTGRCCACARPTCTGRTSAATTASNIGVVCAGTAGHRPTRAQRETYAWLLRNAHTDALPRRRTAPREDLRDAELLVHHMWHGHSTNPCAGWFEEMFLAGVDQPAMGCGGRTRDGPQRSKRRLPARRPTTAASSPTAAT